MQEEIHDQNSRYRPPEHNPHQLNYEAGPAFKGFQLKDLWQVKILRRSVDARKKPDVKIIYTIEVAVDGNEGKTSATPAASGLPLPRLTTISHPSRS